MAISHHHHRLRKLIRYGMIMVPLGLMCLVPMTALVGLIPNPLVNLRLLGRAIKLLGHPVRDIGQLLQAIVLLRIADRDHFVVIDHARWQKKEILLLCPLLLLILIMLKLLESFSMKGL